MPAGPAARASQARILTCACGRVASAAIGGEHLERERLQRVAGEDRGRLVELPVRRGAAAPQIVVVHRRQIVVHERVGVNQLDGGGDAIEQLFGGTDELAARVDEQWPDTLTAAEHGVAHCIEQSLGHVVVGTENVGELLVDSAAVMIEPLCERAHLRPVLSSRAILTPKRRARREPSW